jgi:hypothetical protein
MEGFEMPREGSPGTLTRAAGGGVARLLASPKCGQDFGGLTRRWTYAASLVGFVCGRLTASAVARRSQSPQHWSQHRSWMEECPYVANRPWSPFRATSPAP